MSKRSILRDHSSIRISTRTAVDCPKCGAPAGKHCMGVNQLRKRNHRERYLSR